MITCIVSTIVTMYGHENMKCANNKCMSDHLHSVIPKKFYINSVIAGMVVSAAVNHKKREKGIIA